MKKVDFDALRARMHGKALKKAMDFYKKKLRKEEQK